MSYYSYEWHVGEKREMVAGFRLMGKSIEKTRR